jgi:ABC-type bacteriocin/lantibiotic exporter with double-glycine peptidase domain
MKSVIEARVAAKFAFEVIDRVPPIILDDKKADHHNLEGQIEFKNIDFIYPTRPD